MASDYLANITKTYGIKNMWEYWCKAIGQKAYDDNNRADAVALIRTGWVVLHIVTCLAIIANAIANHGWGLIGV
jgi:hypothetical protein